MPRLRLRDSSLSPALRGWLLVDPAGLPRYWATIWADVLKAGWEPGTRARHLASLEKLYVSVAQQSGTDCLDQMISALDFSRLEESLTGFLAGLRNESAISGVDREALWASSLNFLSDVLGHLGTSLGSDFAPVQAQLIRLERLYRQISPTPPRSAAPIRALSSVVVEDLYRLFDPESPDNPFRTPALRCRNFLLFLLLLHLGLRRGEVAILAADAVKDDFDPCTGMVKFWLNVDETSLHDEDTRYDAPSLKTSQSRRQLPLSAEIVKIVDLLVQNYRSGSSHRFLIGSQWGKPISLRSLHRVFETVSLHLSEPARRSLAHRGKVHVSAHDLRHTCAVYRLARYQEQGHDLDAAIEKMRVFFGWSRESQMPRHYARAYFETKLAEVWGDDYDSFVQTLRSLEGAAC